jgi:hypothetical protein
MQKFSSSSKTVTQRKASSPAENSSNMKFLHLILFWGPTSACLGPDPEPDPLTHLNPD